MKFMYALLISVLFLFVGCAKDGTPSHVTGSKDDFEVTFLFEKDGISVYRFYDSGRYRYFTTRGDVMTEQSAGKSTFDETINGVK